MEVTSRGDWRLPAESRPRCWARSEPGLNVTCGWGEAAPQRRRDHQASPRAAVEALVDGIALVLQ
ncbi:MAG: hypothetical protein EBU88_18085, partial [Acidobacteria bacterium]|nr:hypothetical protein [Acidobacteriota bacterium]